MAATPPSKGIHRSQSSLPTLVSRPGGDKSPAPYAAFDRRSRPAIPSRVPAAGGVDDGDGGGKAPKGKASKGRTDPLLDSPARTSPASKSMYGVEALDPSFMSPKSVITVGPPSSVLATPDAFLDAEERAAIADPRAAWLSPPSAKGKLRTNSAHLEPLSAQVRA